MIEFSPTMWIMIGWCLFIKFPCQKLHTSFMVRYRGIAQMEPMDPSYESATEFVEKSWKNLCPKNRSLENPWWLWSGLVAMGSKICGMIASENGREISRVCWLQGEIHHEFHGLHFFHFFSRSIPHARRVQIPIFSNICWSNVRLFVLTCSFQVYFANTAAHVGSLTGRIIEDEHWVCPELGGFKMSSLIEKVII